MLATTSTLASTALFQDLTIDETATILHSLRRREIDARRTIFDVGQQATCLFLIESGLVKVSYITPDGDNKILNVMETGEIFGDLFLGVYRFRIGQAMALDDAVIYQLNERELYRLIRDYPQVGVNFIRYQADAHRRTMARMHALLRTDAKSRLLGTLLYLARNKCCSNGHTFTLNPVITQQDIADLTGLNRSTVSTLINRLRDEGILGGSGRVLQMDVILLEELLWDEGFELLE